VEDTANASVVVSILRPHSGTLPTFGERCYRIRRINFLGAEASKKGLPPNHFDSISLSKNLIAFVSQIKIDSNMDDVLEFKWIVGAYKWCKA